MFYKLKNDKRGMTLIEMIISLVILSILMTSTMGMITSSMSIFTSTSQAALDKMVGNSVYNILESAAKFSTHMKIVDRDKNVAEGEYAQKISVQNYDDASKSGKLWYKMADDDTSVNLYSDDFYNGRTIQYKFEKIGSDNKHVKITVNVYRDDGQGNLVSKYQIDGIIKCVNLGLLKSGVSSNEIDDTGVTKNDANAFNQDIYFTADELLISGGDTAWAIEYKIQEYMNKYNKILAEYFGKIEVAQSAVAALNNNATLGKVVEYTTLSEAVSVRQTALFGSDSSFYNPNVASDAIADGDNASNYNNLRKYYQQKIYELLKFSPIDTYNGVLTPQIYSPGMGTNVDNPYYGVVATKEQLYTGFLLTYYDENNDGQVTKSEMPKFTNPNTFFAGTMFANNDYAEEMTILGYFMENSAEQYANLVTTTVKGINYFRAGDVDNVNYTWVSGSSSGKNWSSITGNGSSSVYSTTPDKYISSGGTGKRAYSIRSTTGSSFLPWKSYRYDTSLSGEAFLGSIEMKETMFGSGAYSNDAKTAGAYVVGKLNATRLSSANCSYTASDSYGGSASTKFTITTLSDLSEGWYYVIERYDNKSTLDSDSTDGNYAFHFFYLESTQNEANSTNRVAVATGRTIELYSTNWSIQAAGASAYRYQQAKILEAGNTTVSKGSENVFTYQVKQHSYNDYILYSVDWNSWFGSSSGLINGLINSFTNWLKSAIWKDTSWNITSIRGSNANQSLGRTGQFNVNNAGGNDKSYQYAWLVYNQNRGTWYYLPTGSNRINSALSGNSWYSAKNNPTALDVTAWGSSSKMISEIETRKITTGILFGLSSTQYDGLWVALPSVDTVSEEE